jgi:hypothetical protein
MADVGEQMDRCKRHEHWNSFQTQNAYLARRTCEIPAEEIRNNPKSLEQHKKGNFSKIEGRLSFH